MQHCSTCWKLQENYVNHRPNIANNEVTAMQVLAKAADAFSDGDVINRRVRMKQEWNLMPAAAVLGTVYPASYMRSAPSLDFLSSHVGRLFVVLQDCALGRPAEPGTGEDFLRKNDTVPP